ncbi:S-locus glycoprotein [Trema orientale]|uniref:S-locus glycoprotein n=1 Tax=Trema orientale TaxID=63057 RepID=A0A2P5E7F0_TREOI|nr:S-locus glycoprotein [Trema orientale]
MSMDTSHFIFILYTSLTSFLIFTEFSKAADSITQTQSITDGKTLLSSGQTFELGFFSPGKSSNRSLGIWYKAAPNAVIWVANRNSPLTDSHGQFTISDQGSLVLLNQTKSIIWSSNSSSIGKYLVAQLLDSGNLVLYEDGFSNFSSEVYLWQSFDHPTDTLLAGMKLGWNFETGLERYLTSWKSDDDPSDGDYTFSGFSVLSHTIFQPVVVLNENESYYMFEPYINSVATRITLNHSGVEQRFILKSGSSTEWTIMYSLPYQQCDSYGFCGANSICRISGDPICDCFGRIHSQGEGFVRIFGVKLPDLLEFELNKSMSLEECKVECFKNCSCTAYSNSDVRNGGSGCLMWFVEAIMKILNYLYLIWIPLLLLQKISPQHV